MGRTSALLARWAAARGLLELAARTRVEVNPRLRRSLGRCRPVAGVIQLSTRVVAGDGRRLFAEALCHEFAHLAVRARHRRRTAPHGPEWKALMVEAGFAPCARLDLGAASVDLGGARRSKGAGAAEARRPGLCYLHRCPVCHASRMARRPVPAWRCPGCVAAGLGGALIIESRPAAVPSAIEAAYRPDGFTIGINVGEAAGQTVSHLHVHLIPRYRGDVADPRGGVRHLIPGKGFYQAGPLRPGADRSAAANRPTADRRVIVTGGDDPFRDHLVEQLGRAIRADVAAAFDRLFAGSPVRLDRDWIDRYRARRRLLVGMVGVAPRTFEPRKKVTVKRVRGRRKSIFGCPPRGTSRGA